MPRPSVVIPLTMDSSDVVKSIESLKNSIKKSASEMNAYFSTASMVSRLARKLTTPFFEMSKAAREHSKKVGGDLDKLTTLQETSLKKLEVGAGYAFTTLLRGFGAFDSLWRGSMMILGNVGDYLTDALGDADLLLQKIKDIDAVGAAKTKEESVAKTRQAEGVAGPGQAPPPEGFLARWSRRSAELWGVRTPGQEVRESENLGRAAMETAAAESRANREARTKSELEAGQANRAEERRKAKEESDRIKRAAEKEREERARQQLKTSEEFLKYWRESEDNEARMRQERIDNLKSLQDQEAEALSKGRAEAYERERQDSAAATAWRNENAAKTYNQIKDASISAGMELVSGGLAVATEAAVQGENVLGALNAFAGGVIKTLGQTLIQLGTMGLLASTLGTVVPALQPFTGGPPGIGVSTAAIAGGVAMVALGAAMGGRGGSSASGVGSSGSVRTWSAPGVASASTSARGQDSYIGSSGGTRIVNVYLQGAVIGSSPSDAGRQIQGWLRAAERRGYGN